MKKRLEPLVYRRKTPSMGPQHSLRELSAEVGMEQRALMGIMRRLGAPAPSNSLRHSGVNTRRDTYFDIAAFRAWWKTVPDSEKVKREG